MATQDTESVDTQQENEEPERPPELDELLAALGDPNDLSQRCVPSRCAELPEPARLAEAFVYGLARIEDAQTAALEWLKRIRWDFDWFTDDYRVEGWIVEEDLDAAGAQLGHVRLALLKVLYAVNRSPLLQIDREAWEAVRELAPWPWTFPDKIVKAAVLHLLAQRNHRTVVERYVKDDGPTAKDLRKPGRRNSAKKKVHGGRSKRK